MTGGQAAEWRGPGEAMQHRRGWPRRRVLVREAWRGGHARLGVLPRLRSAPPAPPPPPCQHAVPAVRHDCRHDCRRCPRIPCRCPGHDPANHRRVQVRPPPRFRFLLTRCQRWARAPVCQQTLLPCPSPAAAARRLLHQCRSPRAPPGRQPHGG